MEASCAFQTSVRAGRLVEIVPGATLADGLGGNPDPETITFAFIQQLVDRIVTVSEDDLSAAIVGLVEAEHLVAEGAGAAATAALVGERVDVAGPPGRGDSDRGEHRSRASRIASFPPVGAELARPEAVRAAGRAENARGPSKLGPYGRPASAVRAASRSRSYAAAMCCCAAGMGDLFTTFVQGYERPRRLTLLRSHAIGSDQ